MGCNTEVSAKALVGNHTLKRVLHENLLNKKTVIRCISRMQLASLGPSHVFQMQVIIFHQNLVTDTYLEY